MKNELTYVKALEMVENGTINDDVLAKLALLKASLIKKANAPRGDTATQRENEVIKNGLITVITHDNQTATEIQKAYNAKYNTDFSLNKVVALLRQLIEDNSVVRIEDKKKTYFKLVD